jgi:hypothetical protein
LKRGGGGDCWQFAAEQHSLQRRLSVLEDEVALNSVLIDCRQYNCCIPDVTVIEFSHFDNTIQQSPNADLNQEACRQTLARVWL